MTGSWRHRNKPLCFTTYLKFPLWANNSFSRKKLHIKILTPKRHGIIQRKECVGITPGINTRTFWRIIRVRSSVVGKRTRDEPREEEVAAECAMSHSEGHRCWHALSLPHSNGTVCTRALCAPHQSAATRNTKTVQSPTAHLPIYRRWRGGSEQWSRRPLKTPRGWGRHTEFFGKEENTNDRSHCPHGLRRRSAIAHLLVLRVRIPPASWMSVMSVVCCQVVSASSWSLVQRSPTDCGVSNECEHEASIMRRSWPTGGGGLLCHGVEWGEKNTK